MIANPSLHTVATPDHRRLAWYVAGGVPLTIAIFALLFSPSAVFSETLAAAVGGTLIALLAAASFTDIRCQRIPNWATYPALFWALGFNLMASCMPGGALPVDEPGGMGAIGIGRSLLGAAGCFALMLMVYQIAGSGAGDVKLATAIGALLGVQQGVAVILWCHVAAGVAILAWLVWSIGPWKSLVLFARQLGSVFLPMWVAAPALEGRRVLQRPVPLAAFFAVGTILTLWPAGGVWPLQ